MNEPIDISIIIPAYNEAKRLPRFLEQLSDYCAASPKSIEVIVVDDGSRDGTAQAAQSFASALPGLNVLSNARNFGKGYSVKRGLFDARGAIRVFMDADGSTGPQEIDRNLHYFEEGADIVVGSRVLTREGQVLQVKLLRKLIGTAFNFFIRAFLFDGIKDTQCGFKMFRAGVIEPLLSRIYLTGFGFDIELLYLAHKMGYKIVEEPVSWHHVTQSKVNLLTDSAVMFVNILQVRNWHCTPINPHTPYMGPDEYRFMYEMEERHWWFTSRRELIYHLLKGIKKDGPKIIDCGSGTGANLEMFSQFGSVTGVDGSDRAVAFCKKRGFDDVVCSPVEHVDRPDAQFDIATCLDVLEHTLDPVAALREMKRLLKDDGRMIITVPAFRFLWSQHDDALCHRRRYDRPSLLRDLEAAGLKAEKMSYFFFAPFFAVAPIRFFRRFWASKDKAYSDTTTLPPAFLNAALKAVLKIEAQATLKWGLPFGTTLYAVVAKKEHAAAD